MSETTIDITKNQSRIKKRYKLIPADCFSPYRDFRNDVFSFSCLYPDKLTPDKRSDYKYRLRGKARKTKED